MRFFTDCPPVSPTQRPPRASYIVLLADGTRVAVQDYAALLRLIDTLPRGTQWRVRESG